MISQPHILIVDDDTRIRQLLRNFLAEKDFAVTVAASAEDARRKLRGLQFDLMVLDIMMPGENGRELTESLRETGNAVPILMLSALAEVDDRIAGLSAGSDDYLSKPFEPKELLLRINSILRRGKTEAAVETVQFGRFEFHLAKAELREAGTPVHLTTRERDFLRILAAKAGMPVSRHELAGEGAEKGSTRGVDVQITRLRRKIEQDPAVPLYLQTVRSSGYVLHVD